VFDSILTIDDGVLILCCTNTNSKIFYAKKGGFVLFSGFLELHLWEP